ncbi:hypothetical protein D5086_033524 [Populus alba]|uniref:Uncharacterized protein n=1 Tax=Populus alba TaxID=43335 RepID=A0ACC4AH19_POPAL
MSEHNITHGNETKTMGSECFRNSHQNSSKKLQHTRPGSLRTYVYEGVRDKSLPNTFVVDIGQLVNADIVLTTYDVLKEDLSHDSDSHEGDRHILRFQKRYPNYSNKNILLGGGFAQMVKSNAAAATEMTPIQRKLDDLHGLLRF